jgi:very-short-patch-repair endonuclease
MMADPEAHTSSPLPPAGEGGAKRRVRADGRKADSTVKARKLRVASTDAERILWVHLRNRHLGGYRFVRQYPIGPYFADFACRDAMLVVEVDGGQHSDSSSDIARDRLFNEVGYGVLRYWNTDVTRNLNGVLETLLLTLEGRPSPGLRFAPATLSRHAGEGKNGALLPSPARGRGWREAPGEGLLNTQSDE